MAYETYFKNFNQIQYGNSTSNVAIVDITERVVALTNVEKNPYIFYPQDITSGRRADQVAYENYKDPFSSWVLYLTNEITDPYYDWYLDQDQFNSFINTKYGSIANAMTTVAFWRNNWVDQPALTVAAYNALPANLVKYWQPVYNGTSIISYTRTQTDWIMNTNQIVYYNTTANTSALIPNEVVNLSGNGQAQFIQANSGLLAVQHTFGNTTITGGYIYGTQSGANIAITSTNTVVQVIPLSEEAYWSPVYNYDMENEKNQGNRTIRVMQPQYVPQFIKNFKADLSTT
jgi:hypothetical protein